MYVSKYSRNQIRWFIRQAGSKSGWIGFGCIYPLASTQMFNFVAPPIIAALALLRCVILRILLCLCIDELLGRGLAREAREVDGQGCVGKSMARAA